MILREEVLIDTPTDPFAGLGFDNIGGAFTGAACVVKMYDLFVQRVPSVAFTYQVYTFNFLFSCGFIQAGLG